jgi:hypothetical protein
VSALVVVEYVSLDGVIQAPACRRDPEGVTVVATYALWTYLTIPFVLVEPGFELWELEPWEEGGEHWQRIGVRFPSEIHTHCREQILYFDHKGLVRRHDYTSEVFGSWAKAAHYPFDHQSFDGVAVPMRRRVFLRRRGNRPLTAVTLIRLDIEAVRLVSGTRSE